MNHLKNLCTIVLLKTIRRKKFLVDQFILKWLISYENQISRYVRFNFESNISSVYNQQKFQKNILKSMIHQYNVNIRVRTVYSNKYSLLCVKKYLVVSNTKLHLD